MLNAISVHIFLRTSHIFVVEGKGEDDLEEEEFDSRLLGRADVLAAIPKSILRPHN